MTSRTSIFAGVVGLCSLLLGASQGYAQKDSKGTKGDPKSAAKTTIGKKTSSTLPADTSVKVGTLSNGLTYYIRANAKPEQQAKLLLVVRAGSLQEDDDQRGLAHFLEHMAFNGTRRFKEHQLVSYLESIGLRFGADLNAMTTFDRTMYELQVPTNKPEQLSTAFDILADWADGITLDSLEVVAERGVVLEEWRRNLGPASRIQDKHTPVMYKGSRYVDRMPIGSPDIIQAANPTALKRFYHDWYRPNLMAVVAVGDFDPAQIERMITERFSAMKNPSPERARESYDVPQNADPLFSVVADSSVGDVSLSVTYKVPKAKGDARSILRLSLASALFTGAVNQRLRDITQVPNPPFRSAQVGGGGLTDTQGTFSIDVVAQRQSPIGSLNAALAEVERIARFGISDAEMERMRGNMLKGAERGFLERHQIPSPGYAQAYAEHFMSGGDLSDPEAYLAMYREVLPTITNDDIKDVASIWRTKENRIFAMTLPKRNDILVPETSSLLSAVESVEQMSLTPYEETRVKQEPLLATLPQPGKIVSKKTREHGISEWTLSNGIRVFLRPSQQTTDAVMIQGGSAGGYYLNMDQAGFVPASTAAQMIGMSGAGKFKADELGKMLSGRSVRAGWNIGPYDESVNVSATRGDLETALQLMYLAVTQPRIDTAAIEIFKAQAKMSKANHVASPEEAFQDTIQLTMSQHHPLTLKEINADVDSLSPERSLQVVRDRFRDMSDFRFVIVGNFEPDSLAPLIEQYIATLPGGGRKETIVDPGVRRPTGMVRKTVVGGTDPKTVTVLSFYGPIAATREDQWNLHALGEILKLRLMDRLREQLGGTYGVQVAAVATRLPTTTYSIEISFISAPERAEELTRAALEELERLQREPALEADMQKVSEVQARNFEEQFKNDMVWAQRIALYDDMQFPFSWITDDSVFKAWTAKDVQKTAQKLLNLKSFAHFDLVPVSSVGTK